MALRAESDQKVLRPGSNRILFGKSFSHGSKPKVIVALAGLNAGAPGGVLGCNVTLKAADELGFDVDVDSNGGNVANVTVSWMAIGE